jgi:hypothetical protein
MFAVAIGSSAEHGSSTRMTSGLTTVAEGGLASYRPDGVDLCRRSTAYVDRILKGEKPANLPVQQPIKYEPVVNLKTAKSLGLTIPRIPLAQANEVIEWRARCMSPNGSERVTNRPTADPGDEARPCPSPSKATLPERSDTASGCGLQRLCDSSS